jgi:predicted ArsR family transcriptional regulator
MSSSNWQDRILASTRGRVISLLRYGPRTVNELAASLELTDNAVRVHLSALERDGLVQQEGLRRALGKPAFIYRLTEQAETFFPKAYATILGSVLTALRKERGASGLEELLRAVGQEAGERARREGAPLGERVNAAAALLGDLGGLAVVDEQDESYMIRGFSCPLGAIVGPNPEACAMAEELVGGVIGRKVTECCDRSNAPRCAFRIDKAS